MRGGRARQGRERGRERESDKDRDSESIARARQTRDEGGRRARRREEGWSEGMERDGY